MWTQFDVDLTTISVKHTQWTACCTRCRVPNAGTHIQGHIRTTSQSNLFIEPRPPGVHIWCCDGCFPSLKRVNTTSPNATCCNWNQENSESTGHYVQHVARLNCNRSRRIIIRPIREKRIKTTRTYMYDVLKPKCTLLSLALLLNRRDLAPQRSW